MLEKIWATAVADAAATAARPAAMTGAMTMRSRPLVSVSRRTRKKTTTSPKTASPAFSMIAKTPLSRGSAVMVGHQEDAGYPAEVAVDVITTRLLVTSIQPVRTAR